MPEWHQLVCMSGYVKESETAKILQLYATSRSTSVSTRLKQKNLFRRPYFWKPGWHIPTQKLFEYSQVVKGYSSGLYCCTSLKWLCIDSCLLFDICCETFCLKLVYNTCSLSCEGDVVTCCTSDLYCWTYSKWLCIYSCLLYSFFH